jgi:hypothetical protein
VVGDGQRRHAEIGGAATTSSMRAPSPKEKLVQMEVTKLTAHSVAGLARQ